MIQPTWVDAARDAAPYFGVAFAFGVVYGAFELLRMFERSVLRALRNRFGLILVLLNAATAALVYAATRASGISKSPLLTAVIVGVTFPVLLRSRLTVLRGAHRPSDGTAGTATSAGAATSSTTSAAGDVSLPFDRWYDKLQWLCEQEVGADLALERAVVADQLTRRLTASQLMREIRKRIAAHPLAATREQAEKKLEDLRARGLPPEDESLYLAHMYADLLSTGELSKLRLGRLTIGDPMAPGGSPTPAPDLPAETPARTGRTSDGPVTDSGLLNASRPRTEGAVKTDPPGTPS